MRLIKISSNIDFIALHKKIDNYVVCQHQCSKCVDQRMIKDNIVSSGSLNYDKINYNYKLLLVFFLCHRKSNPLCSLSMFSWETIWWTSCRGSLEFTNPKLSNTDLKMMLIKLHYINQNASNLVISDQYCDDDYIII